MLYEYLFLLVNVIFWATLGATEGFKWTSCPNLVTAKNYHIFRAFTNGAFLLAIGLGATILGSLGASLIAIKLLATTAFAWSFYEMMLNYVNHGAFIHQKSEYVFGNWTFKYPPAIIVPITGIIGLVTSIALIYLK